MSDVKTDRAPDEVEEPPRGRGPLPPALYPLLAAGLGAVLVWAASRIFLAVSEIEGEVDLGVVSVSGKTLTAFIALFIALNVLVGAALVANGRRIRGLPASWPLLVGAGVLLMAGGVLAATLGEAGGEGGGGPVATVALSAQSLQFDKAELTFPGDSPVAIEFANNEAGVQHNVAIYADDTLAQVIFKGALVTGVATTTYEFTSPPPGEYYFHCDVHPTMNGQVSVTPGGPGPGGEPGGGGGPGSPVPLVASGTAFDASELSVSGGGPVTISFDNQDAGLPHNVSVYTDPSAAEVVFGGQLVTGPAKVDYTFEAPPPGEYFFRCDVHPTEMTGTLTVT